MNAGDVGFLFLFGDNSVSVTGLRVAWFIPRSYPIKDLAHSFSRCMELEELVTRSKCDGSTIFNVIQDVSDMLC